VEFHLGAGLETTSRRYRITATLMRSRDSILTRRRGLPEEPRDGHRRGDSRLKSLAASVSVENGLLREKIARLQPSRTLFPQPASHARRAARLSSKRCPGHYAGRVSSSAQIKSRTRLYIRPVSVDPHGRFWPYTDTGWLLAYTHDLSRCSETVTGIALTSRNRKLNPSGSEIAPNQPGFRKQ